MQPLRLHVDPTAGHNGTPSLAWGPLEVEATQLLNCSGGGGGGASLDGSLKLSTESRARGRGRDRGRAGGLPTCLSGFAIRKLLLHPRLVRGECRPRAPGERIPESIAAVLCPAQMEHVEKEGCGFFILSDGSVLLDTL
jgi:hypothetical protein